MYVYVPIRNKISKWKCKKNFFCGTCVPICSLCLIEVVFDGSPCALAFCQIADLFTKVSDVVSSCRYDDIFPVTKKVLGLN